MKIFLFKFFSQLIFSKKSEFFSPEIKVWHVDDPWENKFFRKNDDNPSRLELQISSVTLTGKHDSVFHIRYFCFCLFLSEIFAKRNAKATGVVFKDH